MTTDIITLAESIASALGADFTTVPPKVDNTPRAVIQHATGYCFYVGSAGIKGRLSISPYWPRDRKNNLYRPWREEDKIAVITVAATKTPEQIARDIERRFLPGYVPVWQLQKARADEADNYEDSRQVKLRALAVTLGVEYRPVSIIGSFQCSISSRYDAPHPRIECTVNGDVYVKIDNLTLEQAQSVIALVQSFVKERK